MFGMRRGVKLDTAALVLEQRRAPRAGEGVAKQVRDVADEAALMAWCDDGGPCVYELPEPQSVGETAPASVAARSAAAPHDWFFLYWA